MIVKLLTEHHLEFLSLKEAAQDRLSLHLSECQIVGNLMPQIIYEHSCKILYIHCFVCNSLCTDITSKLFVN